MGDYSQFRIRIYDIDSTLGSPSNDLIDTIIEIKSRKKHISIDLNPYNIILPNEEFFIAIEWLIIPANERKIKYKIEGSKLISIQYSPFISFTSKYKDNLGENANAQDWKKNYNGK